MKSKFKNRCANCGQMIWIGDEIGKDFTRNKWVHEYCVGGADIVASKKTVSLDNLIMQAEANSIQDTDTQMMGDTNFTPSVYQEAIFDFVANGKGNAVIEAVAGSGKTTTIVKALSLTKPTDRVAFLAFNKHIATELKKRAPDHVHVSTIHSLGYSILNKLEKKPEIDSDKTGRHMDEIWPIDKSISPPIKAANRQKRSHMRKLVGLCKATLADYSSINEINSMCERYGIDMNGEGEEITSQLPIVMKSCEKDLETIDFDDMIYLPLVNQRLKINFEKFDFLFIDEAQDLNKSQIEFVLNSLQPVTGRIIAVGDRKQCQPPNTLVTMTGGEKKRIADIQPGEKVLAFERWKSYLSGRKTQGRKVLSVGARQYFGDLINVCVDNEKTQCTPNHKWLIRFIKNPNVWVVYLMKKDNWYRVGWCQLFGKGGSFHLGQRSRLESADATWILKTFDNKTDASIYESVVATKYGLPLIPFHAINGAAHLTNKSIQFFFDQVGMLSHRALECLEKHGLEYNYPLYSKQERKRQGRTTLFVTHAANLLDGLMQVPVDVGSKKPEWKTISISREKYNGMVFSLEVESSSRYPSDIGGYYVADNIVTHNSLYGFRGADVEAIPRLIEMLDATVLPLSISYRCPRLIVEKAKEIVPQIEASDTAPDGEILDVSYKNFLKEVEPGDMVICRTNAPLVKPAFETIRSMKKAIIRGKDIGNQLVNFVERFQATDLSTLEILMQEYTIKEYNRLLDQGKELAADTVVDKLETIKSVSNECVTVAELTSKLDMLFSDSNIGVVFSSVHRAKGLEANRVYILNEELMPHPKAKMDWEIEQEWNVLYVAYTRSKDKLIFVKEDET